MKLPAWHTKDDRRLLFMKLELAGKVALVSGCSQGLGYACVRTLARYGADIFGVSIGDDSALKKEVEALGRSYHSLTVSLTTPGSIHEVMKEMLAAYGHVDILLNFAGILKKEDTLKISRQAFQSALDINVTAAFTLSQEVIRQYIRQGYGGKIINASGILPYGTNEYCAYFTSKGAVEAMTKYMAHEFAGQNIQINAITLGFMNEGNKLQSGEGQQDDVSILQDIPAGRWGTWEDLDGLLLVLCSGAGSYINGACIPLDGGYSI